jgi:hypothetical protein
MADATSVPGITVAPIPLGEILPWALFAVLALLAIIFRGGGGRRYLAYQWHVCA